MSSHVQVRNLFPKSSKRSIVVQPRKIESLDWKKIASLDIDKSLDDDTLSDILPQIAYCQPDIEFDHNRTDPGFRKVFRLGQLIIEQLLESQEVAGERAVVMDTKYGQVLRKSKEQEEELRSVKSRLVEAKKELRRRKELIEQNQLELYGGANDEIEQCPYCDKKFVNSVYLFSHLQRRHQGLPAYRVPTGRHSDNVIVTNNNIPQGVSSQEKTLLVVAVTQTDDIPFSSPPDLIEQPWRQGAIGSVHLSRDSDGQWTSCGQDNHNLHGITVVAEKPVSSPNPITSDWNQNQTEVTISVMKEALESQWKNMIEKMHKTEIEELKNSLLEEMHKMQAIIQSSVSEPLKSTVVSPSSSLPMTTVAMATVPSPGSVMGKVEERIQKQEDEFENLKINLQARIRTDIGLIESRMESQERFWRAKLRTVETEYQDRIVRLREEVGAKLNSVQEPIPYQRSVASSTTKVNVNWPSDDAMMVHVKPPTPLTSSPPNRDRAVAVSAVPETSGNESSKVIPPVPKPRPRKFQSQTLPRPQVVTGLPPKVPRELRPEVKVLSKSLDLTDLTVTAGTMSPELSSEDSTSMGTYTSPPVMPVSVTKSLVKDNVTMTTTDIQTETDDLDRIAVGRPAGSTDTALAQGLQQLSRQLQELGISPKATQLPKKSMKKSIAVMKERRKSLNEDLENFAADRQTLKEETNVAGNTKVLETKLMDMIHSKRLSSKPLTLPATSPLSKMFRAVKRSGSTLKRKMTLMTASRRRPKVKVMSPRLLRSPTTPKPMPNRKVIPVPTSTSPGSNKKPKLTSLFKRSLLGKKSDSEPDLAERGSETPVLKRARPLHPVTPGPLRPPGPDHESGGDDRFHLHEIHRKAIKEIELGKRSVPGPSSGLYNGSSDSEEDELFQPFHSSPAKNRTNLDPPSVSSVLDEDNTTDDASSDDISEAESEPVRKSGYESDKEIESVPKAPRLVSVRTEFPSKPVTFDKFGFKVRNRSESSSESSVSKPGRAKGLKRLQDTGGRVSPNQRHDPKKSPLFKQRKGRDMLNEPSDWTTSGHDSSKQDPKPNSGTKSKPLFVVPGMNSKRKDKG